jgi:hypothetical protein
MSPSINSAEYFRPGSMLRTYANRRVIIYRAERIDPKTRVVEGAMLDDRGSMITRFSMSFDSWEHTAERART